MSGEVCGEEALGLVQASGAEVVLMDDAATLEGLKAGACGYLRKDGSPDQLRQAIEDVVAGKTVVRRAITERGFARFKGLQQKSEINELPETLTARETEALTILGKLGVLDRTRVVLKALDPGLL